MLSSTTRTTSAILDSAVDDAVLAYAEWRHASAAVRHAYGQWDSAARTDYACAHAAYLVAVDQEEAAASAYAELIGRVTLLLVGAS